jgi:hypothetical protein
VSGLPPQHQQRRRSRPFRSFRALGPKRRQPVSQVGTGEEGPGGTFAKEGTQSRAVSLSVGILLVQEVKTLLHNRTDRRETPTVDQCSGKGVLVIPQ